MAKVIQDILIYESGDGGEFQLVNEDLQTVGSITNVIYLALFGGNVEQSTDNTIEIGQERNDWFGNTVTDEILFNSEFERTLLNVVLNSFGVSQLENAALNDLDFLKQYGDVSVEVNIQDIDKMSLLITLQEPNETVRKVKFIWDQLKNELIQEIEL